jgi:hypothetical protein
MRRPLTQAPVALLALAHRNEAGADAAAEAQALHVVERYDRRKRRADARDGRHCRAIGKHCAVDVAAIDREVGRRRRRSHLSSATISIASAISTNDVYLRPHRHNATRCRVAQSLVRFEEDS